MKDDKIEEFEIPEFPENNSGLVRGSVIIPLTDRTNYLVKKGKPIPIGFDGEYVRFRNITWDINDLEKEIEAGFWEVTDEPLDLSSKAVSQFFAATAEGRAK